MNQNFTDDRNNPLNADKNPVERSSKALEFNNLMRRSLRVSDPDDFEQVADALAKKYPTEKREMDFEAAGFPSARRAEPSSTRQVFTASTAEFEQAHGDVEKDLHALINNALLKDVQTELNGWATAIRRAVAIGFNTARFALDPNQRDRAMGVRRLLGNYARISRYVGALTPNLSPNYRQLSKSLDEVANVLLVLMGEALANIGIGGGRFLLQAPAGQLQERRDAVIYALRNLIGSTQVAHGPNDWPRGLHAYRDLNHRLNRNGQHDLRALFQELELTQIMDELIHHATGNTAQGLRTLGATAPLALERFRRMIRFAHDNLPPESPPVSTFLTALRLFLDAFDNGDSGARLLHISRPPILFYGLYGIGGQSNAVQRLIGLIIQRGRLADALDCLLGCDCGVDRVRCQILLDKLLFDVDRAIDYYALGQDDFGEAELRAGAYGHLIIQLLDEDGILFECIGGTQIHEMLGAIINSLLTPERPDPSDESLPLIADELCSQIATEESWHSLLESMAPSCLTQNGFLEEINTIIIEATHAIIGEECSEFNITIPPHHETSLDGIANDILNTGGGRP